MIFFYDKHWYHSEVLATVQEEEEEEEEEEEGEGEAQAREQTEAESVPDSSTSTQRSPSPTPSQATVTSAPVSSQAKKPEYEFLLLNYLLRFVHREGKIGDFARAGLLFLMDVAMSPGVPVHRLGGDGTKSSTSSLSSSSTHQGPEGDPVADAALALAEYILDGDFCDVLGAGLGAVYSLLPSKLEIRSEVHVNAAQQGVMTIGGVSFMSEEEKELYDAAHDKSRGIGIEVSSSPEVKSRLEHFVKLLEFLQDVLRRNVSNHDGDVTVEPVSFVGSAIVQSILDAVRRIFLENVLYPSILECSDTDGSAVAVMSYIDIMFRTLQDTQFAECIIDFLVSEDDSDSSRYRPRTRPTLLLDTTTSAPPPTSNREKKMRRRKSSAMILLEMEAPDARRQSTYFTSMGRFTLKDLLLVNMRSKSNASITAAIQLMQTLISHHCRLSVDRLFIFSYDSSAISSSAPGPRASPDEDEDMFTYPGAETRNESAFNITRPYSRIPEISYSMHERELGLYLGLVSRIDPAHGQGAFSTGYEHYLRDAFINTAGHSCSTCITDIKEGSPRYLLDVNDPVLSLMLQSLRHFFSNTPEQNMALTAMLASIATCPYRSLKGWLLFGTDGTMIQAKSGTEYRFLDDGDDRSVDFNVNERLERNELPMPIHGAGPLSQPVILSILQGLVSNLDRFRDVVPDFDIFLAERRQGLVFSENLTDALSLSFDLSNNAISLAEASNTLRTESGFSHPKPRTKSKSGWVSFLSSRKSKSIHVSPTRSDSSTSSSQGKAVEASPFGAHYRKTSSISVEPLVAPLPASGPWVPVERRAFSHDEEDILGSSGQWGEEKHSDYAPLTQETENENIKTVTLSQLLDNVVILEESIKELTGVIHARRSLGIDSLRYL